MKIGYMQSERNTQRLHMAEKGTADLAFRVPKLE